MPALSKTSPTKVSPTGKKLSVKINAVAQHSPKKSPTSVSQAGSDYHQQQQSVSGSPTSGTVTQSLTSSIANTRAILTVFEKYQKERLGFVQTIADFASREHNIEVLQTAGVMALLKPLLGDPVPAIQQAAAVALGRYDYI